MKLFVAGLPSDMDDAELEEFFEKFGTVSSAKIAMDKATGKSRGFGFVEMPISAEAKEAIEGLNNLALNNRKTMVVKEAEERSGPSAPRGNYPPNRNSGYLKGGYNPNNRRY